MGLSLILKTLFSFGACTLLVGSFDPEKAVPDMTCNVFGWMLSLTLPTYLLVSPKAGKPLPVVYMLFARSVYAALRRYHGVRSMCSVLDILEEKYCLT